VSLQQNSPAHTTGHRTVLQTVNRLRPRSSHSPTLYAEICSIEYWRDLWKWVRGHSRSLTRAQLLPRVADRLCLHRRCVE